jgi:ribosome modulation factor
MEVLCVLLGSVLAAGLVYAIVRFVALRFVAHKWAALLACTATSGVCLLSEWLFLGVGVAVVLLVIDLLSVPAHQRPQTTASGIDARARAFIATKCRRCSESSALLCFCPEMEPVVAAVTHSMTGYAARHAGVPEDVCPYLDAASREGWARGWKQADEELRGS